MGKQGSAYYDQLTRDQVISLLFSVQRELREEHRKRKRMEDCLKRVLRILHCDGDSHERCIFNYANQTGRAIEGKE